MTNSLPSKIYLVDRVPPPSEERGEFRAPYGPLRRFYAMWSHVKLFIGAHSGPYNRAHGAGSNFKVYEADVEWREVNINGR